MKKIIFVSVAIIMMFGLIIGCAEPAPAPSPAPSPGPAPAPAPAPAKEFKWKWQSFLPPPEPQHGESYVKCTEMIAEATNGQVKIELFPMGAVVQTHEMLAAVRDGVLTMCTASAAYYRGAVPMLDVVTGPPFAYLNHNDLYEIIHERGLDDLARKPLSDYGVHLLGIHPEASEGLGILGPEPITSLAVIKGWKMRTHGSYLDWYKALGAETVSMAFPEVYAAIATGTLDSVATAWGGHLDMKFYELLKYGMEPYHAGTDGGMTALNQKAWDDLGPELQGIVTETFDEWRKWDNDVHQTWRTEYYVGKLKELGITWNTVPQSDQDRMLAEAQKIWDQVAAVDDLSAQAMGIVIDYYKDKGRF